MNFISSYSHIRNRSLIRQGEIIYKNTEGKLDDFLDSAFQALSISYPKFYKMDQSAKLGFLGAEMVLQNSALGGSYKPEQVALILANAHGSLDTDVRYFESTKTIASPGIIRLYLAEYCCGRNLHQA